jgi:hypothetical protein
MDVHGFLSYLSKVFFEVLCLELEGTNSRISIRTFVAIRIKAGFGTPSPESESRKKCEEYFAGRDIFDRLNWESRDRTDYYQAAAGIHKLVNGWDVPDRYQ